MSDDKDAIRARLREALERGSYIVGDVADAIRALLDSEKQAREENERLEKLANLSIERLAEATEPGAIGAFAARDVAKAEVVRLTAEVEGWKNQAQDIARSNADHVGWHREMEVKLAAAYEDIASLRERWACVEPGCGRTPDGYASGDLYGQICHGCHRCMEHAEPTCTICGDTGGMRLRCADLKRDLAAEKDRTRSAWDAVGEALGPICGWIDQLLRAIGHMDDMLDSLNERAGKVRRELAAVRAEGQIWIDAERVRYYLDGGAEPPPRVFNNEGDRIGGEDNVPGDDSQAAGA